MSWLWFRPAGELRALDSRFEAYPARDRKRPFDHLFGATAGIVVAKHVALQYTKYLAEEQARPVPTDDAAELARFTFDLVKEPILKDWLIISTARFYEWLLIDRIFKGDDLRGHSFVRDTGKAASDANALALKTDPRSDPVSFLARRWLLAKHSFGVVLPPALVSNAAILTVEEGRLVYDFVRAASAERRAAAVLADPRATPEERSRAARILAVGPDAGRAGRDGSGGKSASPARGVSRLLLQSLDMALRSGSSVVLEALFSATGTFLMPGTGTWMLGAVGATVAWIL